MPTTAVYLIIVTILTLLVAFVGLPWVQRWARQHPSGQPYLSMILDRGQSAIRALMVVLGLNLLFSLADVSDRP